MTEPPARRHRLLALLGLISAAVIHAHRLGSPVLFDDPNDAQYAEVAREMIERGEWLSPRLNGVLFLNKPPLLYWLIAIAYSALGVGELAARLPGLLATLVTAVLVYRLGVELFDVRVGLSAALIYLALPSTYIEARFVRPDSILIATTTAAVLALIIALRSRGWRRHRALAALQLALAGGVLAKGAVALLLLGLPAAALLLAMRRWDALRWIARPQGWLLFVSLALPWHLLAAWRHPGFAWDYLVNQHVLFFFDQKLPRDSIPVPLEVFWSAFAARLFPWTLLAPLAVAHALVWLRRDPARRPGLVLLLVWIGGSLLFFSAAASRLEHYSLPALPPAALLLAAFFFAIERERAWQCAAAGGVAAMLAAVVAGFWLLPVMLREDAWLVHATDLPWLGTLVCASFAAGFTGALIAIRRSVARALAAVLLGGTASLPVVHRGLTSLAPINSSAPIAAALEAVNGEDARIVCEAPIEYQLCAGLIFYLGRPVTLLRPDGFVEPTYLLPHRNELFVERRSLDEIWTRERVLFVTDPLRPDTRPLGAAVPSPFFVLARFGNRWILSNRSPPPSKIRSASVGGPHRDSRARFAADPMAGAHGVGVARRVAGGDASGAAVFGRTGVRDRSGAGASGSPEVPVPGGPGVLGGTRVSAAGGVRPVPGPRDGRGEGERGKGPSFSMRITVATTMRSPSAPRTKPSSSTTAAGERANAAHAVGCRSFSSNTVSRVSRTRTSVPPRVRRPSSPAVQSIRASSPRSCATRGEARTAIWTPSGRRSGSVNTLSSIRTRSPAPISSQVHGRRAQT